jgi:hypothetical protein
MSNAAPHHRRRSPPRAQRVLAIAALLVAVAADPTGRIGHAGGPTIHRTGPIDDASHRTARWVADVDDAVADSASADDNGSHPIAAPLDSPRPPLPASGRSASTARATSPDGAVPGGVRGRSPPRVA